MFLPGCLCSWFHAPSRGVSVTDGFCLTETTQYGEERAICILLECILVTHVIKQISQDSMCTFSGIFNLMRNVYLNLMRQIENQTTEDHGTACDSIDSTQGTHDTLTAVAAALYLLHQWFPEYLHWIGTEFCVELIEQSSVCLGY